MVMVMEPSVTTTEHDRPRCDLEMHWQKGDFFTHAPFCSHEHANRFDSEAILFSTTDASCCPDAR